jgi:hypothetical protein
VQLNTAYVYKVLATSSGGNSAFSPIDTAVTVVFTDANLAGVPMKVAHITELQAAINALLIAAERPTRSFTDLTLPANLNIRAAIINELRSGLDDARGALGFAAISYTDPTITAGVTNTKKEHVTDLRGGVQ